MDDGDELFSVAVPRVMVFTVILVLIFAVYGAASAGRDIMMLVLKASGIL
jgi:uncharacterized membrane protein